MSKAALKHFKRVIHTISPVNRIGCRLSVDTLVKSGNEFMTRSADHFDATLHSIVIFCFRRKNGVLTSEHREAREALRKVARYRMAECFQKQLMSA